MNIGTVALADSSLFQSNQIGSVCKELGLRIKNETQFTDRNYLEVINSGSTSGLIERIFRPKTDFLAMSFSRGLEPAWIVNVYGRCNFGTAAQIARTCSERFAIASIVALRSEEEMVSLSW